MELLKLINNINERVVDDLKNRLSSKSKVSVAAASFSIYAFNSSTEVMGGFLQVSDVESCSYVPFNEFTTTELGLDRGNSVYSMVHSSPSPFAEEYLKIFNVETF